MSETNKTEAELTAEKKREEERLKAEAELTAEKTRKEETVTITKEQFDLILNEIKTLKKGQKELEQTSSPDQIKKIEALRAKGHLIKSVKISEIDGKLVKSWQSTADEVYIDHALGKEVSKQMTKLDFYEGESKDVSQAEFARRKIMKSFEVIKEGKDKIGNIILTVTTEDGKEFDIDSRYIN